MERLRVYRRRHVVAAVYCMCNFINAFMWICFAPVADVVAQEFAVSTLGVNMLSLVYLVAFAPASITAIFVTERYGLRVNIITGAALNLACAWVRYLGSLSSAAAVAYPVVMLGQIMGAFAQGFILQSPTRISGDWFPAHERDLVTVVCTMSNPLGNAFGSFIPTLIVNVPSDVPALLLYQALVCSVIVVPAVIWVRAKPPTPPSVAAEARTRKRAEGRGTTMEKIDDAEFGQAQNAVHTLRQMWRDIMWMLSSRNYLKLFVAFSIGLGTFNGVMTVISQLIAPCGYDNQTAGIAGGALLVTGLIGAGIAGWVMKRTGAYVWVIRVLGVGTTASATFVLLSLQPGNGVQLIASFATMGLFFIPALPAALENAAECTYPIPEDTSAALLLFGGMMAGIVYILVLTAMIAMPTSARCSSTSTPLAWFVGSTVAVATVCLLAFRADYRRKAIDCDVSSSRASFLVAHSDVELLAEREDNQR